jgi:hypothetical protein
VSCYQKTRRRTGTALIVAVAVGLSACFPVRFDAGMSIPEPLVTRLPSGIALRIPPEFANFTQKEKRWSMKWEIGLGKAHTQGITRLLNAMFERVVMVDSIEAGTRVADIGAILEPAIEEYAFVTPRDAGSSFFAVSIKYRMSVYTPEGRLADSWAFTGYGSAPSAGMSDKDSMQRATSLALRDAGAKLAVEFRDQEIVRELLPSPDAVPAGGASTAPADAGRPGPAPAISTAPAQDDAAEAESDEVAEEDAAGEEADPEDSAPPTTQSPPAQQPTSTS